VFWQGASPSGRRKIKGSGVLKQGPKTRGFSRVKVQRFSGSDKSGAGGRVGVQHGQRSRETGHPKKKRKTTKGNVGKAARGNQGERNRLGNKRRLTGGGRRRGPLGGK